MEITSCNYSLPGIAVADAGTDCPPSSPRAMTVNAAFLHEIKEDNVQLRQLLREVESAIDDRSFWHRPSRFARLLDELRDQLAMHFSLEEAYGYFDDAVDAAPELSSLAQSLRAEHRTLYLQATRIAEHADSIARQPRRYRIRYLILRTLAFIDQLGQHERRENNLIRQAYADNTGVGD